MTDSARGIWAMVWACLIWGLSPLYYKLLAHIAPIEVLAHRTRWSFGFFALVLLGQNRLGQLWAAMASPRALVVLGVAALMISTNWFVFILSIQIGHATEASLGYYLFPLVAVALGRVVFKERLDMGQKTAVALAILAVVVSVSAGVPAGLVSGYVGGKLDEVISRSTDLLIAFPGLLIAMTMIAITG
ncbi:MAG: EamA family transporter, partial [Lutimaribacter sp.]